MTFLSIMTFLGCIYMLGYSGMVVYDLFFSKEGLELTPIMEEEEIDISDEAKTFTPTFINKEDNTPPQEENTIPDDVVAMTGGIEVQELVPKLEDLSVNGKDSELGGMVKDWNESYAAA